MQAPDESRDASDRVFMKRYDENGYFWVNRVVVVDTKDGPVEMEEIVIPKTLVDASAVVYGKQFRARIVHAMPDLIPGYHAGSNGRALIPDTLVT